MNSLSGHLLIAIPELFDRNFFRTVVLLFQHSEEGASGVILNRPSEVSVRKIWNEVSDVDCDCDDFVHIGGPVDGPLLTLHTSLALAETPVIPGVFLSMSRDHLNDLVQQDVQQFKVYSGYSGWGPGQLESEIDQGGWLTLPAKSDHVYDSPDGLWKQVCEEVGTDILGEHLGNQIPSDPSLN